MVWRGSLTCLQEWAQCQYCWGGLIYPAVWMQSGQLLTCVNTKGELSHHLPCSSNMWIKDSNSNSNSSCQLQISDIWLQVQSENHTVIQIQKQRQARFLGLGLVSAGFTNEFDYEFDFDLNIKLRFGFKINSSCAFFLICVFSAASKLSLMLKIDNKPKFIHKFKIIWSLRSQSISHPQIQMKMRMQNHIRLAVGCMEPTPDMSWMQSWLKSSCICRT